MAAVALRADPPASPEFSIPGGATPQSRFNSAVASDGSGNFVVVWLTAPATPRDFGVDLYAALYTASGQPKGPAFKVNQGSAVVFTTALRPAVAMDAAGNFVVVWRSGVAAFGYRQIVGQRFDSSGARRGLQFAVTGNGADPSVAMNSRGEFVVAWATSAGTLLPTGLSDSAGFQGIRAQRFAPSGLPLGVPQVIDEALTIDVFGHVTGPFSIRSPEVAINSRGDFVVTWLRGQDFAMGEVYARRYDAGLVSSASPKLQVGVNPPAGTPPRSFKREPKVAIDDAGNFLVTWAGSSSLPEGNGVFGRRYSGVSPVGPEFLIEAETGIGNETTVVGDDVAMDRAGNALVVWDYAPSVGRQPPVVHEVHARRFDSSGAPIGQPFRINTAVNSVAAVSVAANIDNSFITSFSDRPPAAQNSTEVFVARCCTE